MHLIDVPYVYARGSYFCGNLKMSHIFEIYFLGCGVLSPLSNQAEYTRFSIPKKSYCFKKGQGCNVGFLDALFCLEQLIRHGVIT